MVVIVEPMVSYHDLLGCTSLICCWCSFTWVLRDRLLCPVYTWLHSQGILYTPRVFKGNWRSSCVMGQHFICCTWPAFCWCDHMFSGYTKGWPLRCVFFNLVVFPDRFIACCICFLVYPFSLKVFSTNCNSPWMLSLSPVVVALYIKIARTPCLLDAWWCDPVFSRDWT
jgi:hypothetical protein